MATRLDRLFILLDSGSSTVTRKAAANQLGEVQKLHPHELHNLLAKVHVYLRSESWDSRIAAGCAVEAVAKNVPQWRPIKQIKKESAESSPVPMERDPADRLEFSKFNVAKVMENGTSLLGSAGTEYEQDLDTGMDPKERLQTQKKMLQKRLGLGMAGALGMETNDLFNDDDLLVRKTSTEQKTQSNLLENTADLIAKEMANINPGMSSREKNRAKRRAKVLAKQRSRDGEMQSTSLVDKSSSAPPNKKAKLSVEQVDGTAFQEEPGEWCFTSFCEQLSCDLFHSSWEIRHGAATGIREVVKTHGQSAGRSVQYPLDQQDALNHSWLEDMALRLMCVLALDRFGDFVSDEVVAPVRETCAQGLGVILHHMTPVGVHGVMSILLKLQEQPQWETRHGGLLGLKYLLAVREEMTDELLRVCLPFIVSGLQDVDDDVRAVAAAALIPVTGILTKSYPDQLPPIFTILWDTLLDLDDLTASTSSIMMLLAALLSHPNSGSEGSGYHDNREPGAQRQTELVTRLWPFLSHNSTSVRTASLNTLLALVSSGNEKPSKSWLKPILSEALRHIFQRCILETSGDIVQTIEKVWDALLDNVSVADLSTEALPLYNMWLCLAMQPPGIPIDTPMLILAKHKTRVREAAKGNLKGNRQQPASTENDVYYIAGDPGLSNSSEDRLSRVLQTRLNACRLLGHLSAALSREESPSSEDILKTLGEVLAYHLKFKSSVQIIVIALVIDAWAETQKNCLCSREPINLLLSGVSNGIYYDEVAPLFMRLQSECKAVINKFLQMFPDIPPTTFPSGFGIDEAHSLLKSVTEKMTRAPEVSSKSRGDVENKCKQIQGTLEEIEQEQLKLKTRTMACMASAIVHVGALPQKITPIIKPLMDAIKLEKDVGIQEKAASGLAHLIKACLNRNPCPNTKIIRNLVTCLSSDPRCTPSASEPLGPLLDSSGGGGTLSDSEGPLSRSSSPSVLEIHNLCNKLSGILTFAKQQQQAALAAAIRRNVFTRHRLSRTNYSDFSNTNLDPMDDNIYEQKVQRRGAHIALSEISHLFGAELFNQMEMVWLAMTKALSEQVDPSKGSQSFQELDNLASELISGLQLFETLSSLVHKDIHGKILAYLPHLICCLGHPYTSVRHMSARCIGALAAVCQTEVMQEVVVKVIPKLSDVDEETSRQGAMECISCAVDSQGMDIVPYIVLLVVPLMGAMSDQNKSVRHLATQCFATLIRLMPLESGIPDPPMMSKSLVIKKANERVFLDQLFNPNKLENYNIPDSIKAELRKYQQDGVNWLAFLKRYKLHGILCDDMGLGKTLMSLCILAGEYTERQKESKKSTNVWLPSIVICPPTLTGHWVYEVKQFCSSSQLKPLQYTGSPIERSRLQKLVKKHNLVVASYDIVRNDIDFFRSIKWKYCILDEGHIIKNGKTKMSKAIKQLQAAHRLILSGTPIQNNVLELWSLFDFLMPGFLGTEKQFQARFAKPILQSRDAKSSSREQEAGALAMEALHRQVLPFLLRRLKEDVLDDLPPKIIQDYYCDLSPLQIELYEDFAKTRAKQSISDKLATEGRESSVPVTAKGHIFQAIQYLRKVCNHPLLVLTEAHPKFVEIHAKLKQQKSSLRDIQHAPKLAALRQLLQDCGVGVESQESVVGQHRVLLFCQLKGMLDIVEKDLLKAHMPSVTYLRLDGSVPMNQRHGVVQRFNNDPSIDILLLTTHVGGLGLNLTGADTVIFVEHDWNPTKDLQAMDRAHRIGQKKVVNVYRLITKGTLEEKIMGLQKFKLNIANTVISQENSSLQSMGTDQLLDLFQINKDNDGGPTGKMEEPEKPSSVQSVLSGLDELWDSSQYTDEYNLDDFIGSLK
ncbi:TATA-binding protein-associated factor 172-like [Apostichopus japonicus]|uniref:TATA-binding protein-associated factor 172-like n=1 Tax=Stichopus japonicus TaxID=307972 RepID=UPI003AB6CAE2